MDYERARENQDRGKIRAVCLEILSCMRQISVHPLKWKHVAQCLCCSNHGKEYTSILLHTTRKGGTVFMSGRKLMPRAICVATKLQGNHQCYRIA